MKTRTMIPALTATALSLALAATPALADNGKGKGKGKHKHKGHGPDKVVVVDRDRDRDGRYDRDRVIVVDRDRHPGNNPKAQGRHDNGLHLGWYKQRWNRGDRIPVDYLESRYYIDDYQDYTRYGLYAPPEGYRWVRPMDDRYLLVQVATGLVLEALGY